MAISTTTIMDTMEWAKRMSFARNSGLGNSLQPALSNANMVIQTILGPPFTWWWNNSDYVFTASPTLKTGSITNVALSSNVVTLSISSTFAVGQEVIPSGLVAAAFLNGQILQVLTNSGSAITANYVHTNYSTAADSGTLTAVTTQDYTLAVPDFSHVDYAAVLDIGKTPSKWYEMEVKNDLSLDTISARPAWINPQSQDSAGNVTFRLMPAPNLAYPVLLNVMKTAPVKTSLNDTWAPLPDFMQYIYQWGFLALTYMFSDDPRVGYANAKFTSALLSRAEGLTEEERNIFLNTWGVMSGIEQLKSNQGIQARGN